MAACSSDESSQAPENFHVSSSNDCCESQLNSKCCLKCPICTGLRKRFHCQSCIKFGDFLHSSTHFKENFSDKQRKYLHLQASLLKFSNRFESLIRKWKLAEDLQFKIKEKESNVKLLNDLITNKEELIRTHLVHLETLRIKNNKERIILPTYENKVKKLEDFVADRKAKNDIAYHQMQELLAEVKEWTRSDIKNLVKYVFPIAEVILKDEPIVMAENSQTVAALTEAKNTSYIRGKWIFHGSGISEMQYRIVAPSLPANGDYTGYIDWLAENKDDVPKSTANEIVPSRVAAFRIVGALTYTTQLTNLLSFYLDKHLPFKFAYGDFCKKLNEQQFKHKVSRLNSNIMYLAYTQRVKLTELNENHTLENILTILNIEISDLGRHGPHEVTFAPLIKSMDSILIGMETTAESESEDENSIRMDWESVSNVPSDDLSPTISTAPNQQTTSIAGGLMTNAAQSIVSIFRGWSK